MIQAVGRVMRTAPGKKYGYIILPVGIPAGVDPAKALGDNRKYKVIWDVLQALRAHDDRFDATINQIELNDRMPENIVVRKINLLGPGATGDDSAAGDDAEQPKKASEADVAKFVQDALFDSRDLQQAVYAKIVDKCGTRTSWEDWAKDVAQHCGTSHHPHQRHPCPPHPGTDGCVQVHGRCAPKPQRLHHQGTSSGDVGAAHHHQAGLRRAV